MKRLLLTLLCFLTFCNIADARMLQGIAGAVTASPTTPISGTLYKCNAEGTGWDAYYTPYTYPHPLRVQKFSGNTCVGCGGYYN